MSTKADETDSCSFCGQTKIIQAPEEWEQGQINEAITCECEYEQAQAYARARGRKDKAKKRVNKLFGSDAEKPVAEDVVNLLVATVDIIEDRHMKGIIVDMGCGVKAKVSKMTKESIRVERPENRKTIYKEQRIRGTVLQRTDDDTKATVKKTIQGNERHKHRTLNGNVLAFDRMAYNVISEALNNSYHNVDSEAAREQMQKQIYRGAVYCTPYGSTYDVMRGRRQFYDYRSEFITVVAEGLGMLPDSRIERDTGCSSTTGT